MSPHAVLPPTSRLLITEELEQFSVSSNAFLPETQPCSILLDVYYKPWELIAQSLPALIADNLIREAVQQLPCLSTDKLIDESEWRRAYVILAFFAQAYVWGGDEPAQVLPPQITVPFLKVSSHLEVPPILTYAAGNLWNFSSSSSDFSDIDSLRTNLSFTGTESESWFFLISTAMEAKFGSIIQVMMEALAAVKTRNYDVVSHGLEELKLCIDDIGQLLERMYEKCDPMVFYHQIRLFLAGSMNMEAAGLPNGVFYDEGHGKGEWRQLRGGSNGQSSLIQFFDVVLGVDHTSHGCQGQRSFHAEVRDYMPGPHARFLTHVARLGSIRELATAASAENPCTPEEERLRDAYAEAIEALTRFRNKHIQIVTKYIILPSKQPWSGDKRRNIASCSSQLEKVQETLPMSEKRELTGTGGTPLVSFLKTSRDETADAGKLHS